MRALGFHIDGFGVYHDQGLAEIAPGLTLLVGANESGKTTLLEFFRFVLFGPPRRRGAEALYPPLAGGRHGGRIRMALARDHRRGQEVTVERLGAPSGPGGGYQLTLSGSAGTIPDGSTPQQGLQELLGGLDRRLYERVFAIGLEDLQGLAVLTDEDLRGRLLAAGTGLGRVQLPKILKSLDRECKALVTLRGRKATLNQLERESAELDQEIERLQQLPGEMTQLGEERRTLERRLETVQVEIQRLEARLEDLDLLSKALEPWRRQVETREELQGFRGMPGGDSNTLEQALRQIEGLAEEIAAVEDHLEATQEHLQDLDRRLQGLGAGERNTAAPSVAGDSVDGKPGAGIDTPEVADDQLHHLREQRRVLQRLASLLRQAEELDRRKHEAEERRDRARSLLQRLPRGDRMPALPWGWAIVALVLPFALPILWPVGSSWLAAAALGVVLAGATALLIRQQRAGAASRSGDLARRRRTAQEDAQRADRALEELAESRSHLQQEIELVARESDLGVPTRAQEAELLGAELETLIQRHLEGDAQRASGALLEHLEEQRASVKGQRDRLLQRLEDCRHQRLDLLAAGGADDEDQFRDHLQRFAEAARRRQELEGRQRELELTLTTLLGDSDGRQRWEVELSTLWHETPGQEDDGRQALAQEVRRVSQSRESLLEELSEGRGRLGALDQQRLQLTEEDRLNTLLARRERLREQTREALERWAVLTLGAELLRETRARHEQEVQPRLLDDAGRYLSAMTSGRYRLISGPGGLALVDASLRQKVEGTWSAGLADQVYLALRLALVAEFGRRHEPLPVLLDDILVRSDPGRQVAIARVLLEAARTHQILYFTCHPSTRQVFQQAAYTFEPPEPVDSVAVAGGRLTRSPDLPEPESP